MHRVQTQTTLSGFISCAGAVLLLVVSVNAQTSSRTPPPPPKPADPMSADRSLPGDDGPPMTTFEEEMRAKRTIKLAEKEHQQNVDRAREISEIAKQLQLGLKEKTILDREDLKRLDRLEKLTKKIRGEAGGEENEVQIVDRPDTVGKAVNQIAEVSELLSKGVQKTPRQVVSANVIDSANVLLELIRILRTFSPKL